jgi:CTD small phosphatase-like protein 2
MPQKSSFADKMISTNSSFQIKPLREYESDLVVVLDMDECLIHSQFLPNGPGAKYAHQVQRANGSALGESSVDTFNISLPDGELVRVHERPHLHDFLAAVSEKYETHIFTAAMEVYAKPVLKMLDPHGTIFTHCWYRESCTLDSNVGAYVKNLGACAWGGEHQLKRTVLVDNNPLSFLANPENGILVSSFYDDPTDTTLPAVLTLLEELEGHKDVRPVLEARFGLKQALDELSSGRPFAARGQQISEQQQQQQDVQQHLVAAAAN